MSPAGFGASLLLNQESAGKTGTTDSNMSVWFMGYTPNLATAAMIAGANQLGHWITLNGQTIGGTYTDVAHGSTTAGPMWCDAMKADPAVAARRDVHPAERPGRQRRPHHGARRGRRALRPGRRAAAAGRLQRRRRWLPRLAATPPDTVAYTSPGAGQPGRQRHRGHDLPLRRHAVRPAAAAASGTAAAKRHGGERQRRRQRRAATAAATGRATARQPAGPIERGPRRLSRAGGVPRRRRRRRRRGP